MGNGNTYSKFNGWNISNTNSKETNQTYSTQLLIDNDIEFKKSKGGRKLMIGSISFHPRSGRYQDTKTGESGRGVNNLIKLIKSRES